VLWHPSNNGDIGKGDIGKKTFRLIDLDEGGSIVLRRN
jgi:hypothetical protein